MHLEAQCLPIAGVLVSVSEIFNEIIPENLEEGFANDEGQSIIQKGDVACQLLSGPRHCGSRQYPK
jgi:hypothetical protein